MDAAKAAFLVALDRGQITGDVRVLTDEHDAAALKAVKRYLGIKQGANG
jgi:hypothetical protein